MNDKRGFLNKLAVVFGVIFLVALGSAVHVMLNRLSTDVLTVIFAFGCVSGIALPTLFVALVILLRKAENGKSKSVSPQMTQPIMMMVPPMSLPQYQAPQVQAPQPSFEQVPRRRYTVVGEEREF